MSGTVPGEAQQRAALHVAKFKHLARDVLRDERFASDEVAIVLADGVLALVERVEAAAQENKELLGGLYLTKHNLEKAEEALRRADAIRNEAVSAIPSEIWNQLDASIRARLTSGLHVALAGVPVAEEET